MIGTVFGIKVRMSGLCINQSDYRPMIIGPDDNSQLPYRCISTFSHCTITASLCLATPHECQMKQMLITHTDVCNTFRVSRIINQMDKLNQFQSFSFKF